MYKRIVISAQGNALDTPASPVFGRCPTYIFVDSETMEFEAVPNPAVGQGRGAGIQAAQFVANQRAQAVLTGNLGPNAFDVLQAASISSYLVPEGTVRQAVEAFKAGQLQPTGEANVAAYAGIGGGRGFGMGRGGGMGRGMGRGIGRGIGMGGSIQTALPAQPQPQAAPGTQLAELREMLQSLRQQVVETLKRIARLVEEG